MKTNIPIKLLLSVISFYVMIAANSCNNEEILPPQNPVMVKLTLDDVGVTETWIKVSSGDANGTFALKRDSVTIASNLHAPVDTLIHDKGLLPNHTYQYSASTETPLNVTTMDTTSHNFTWEMETFGDVGSSSLYDVAIINDTLAYAVGEIYKKDSLGQIETEPYNAAKWNGRQWQLMRVKIRLDYGTSVVYTSTRITSVFAVTPNDIWFGHYVGGVTRLIDGKWVMMEFPLIEGPGGANKIWGIDSKNIYFVADNGLITFFNGTSWRKIASGTTLNIYDIYGAYNKKTTHYEILAVASNSSSPDRKILQIKGSTVTSISDYTIAYSLSSVWFTPNRHYYVAGSGIYEKQTLQDSKWKNEALDITPYSTSDVHGNGLNDVFFVGSYGDCLHFNGMTYKSYRDVTGMNGVYGVVRSRKNLVIAVGYNERKACLLVGRR